MKIEVTKADIEESLRLWDDGDPESCCPVAVSLRRHGFPDALVCEEVFQLDGAKAKMIVPLPHTVETFVRKFDSNKRAQPFAFYLSIPSTPAS